MADLVDLVETTACCERQSRFFWMVLFANSPRNFLVNLWLKCPFHELHFFFGGVLNESFVDKHLCKHSEFHTCTVESLDYRWSWVIFDDVLLIIKRGEITKQKNDIHMGWCRRKKENFVRSKNSAGGEMTHVIDVRCWQAEMYGCGCWLEAIKRKTAVCDRIKCMLYCCCPLLGWDV